MFTQLLKDASIKQRVNYLLIIVTVSVIGAALFAFYTLSSIGSQYNDLQNHSTGGTIQTLEIQKDLNYISRTSRDILLGGDYEKDMDKLRERISDIRENFEKLATTINDEESLALIEEAKRTTMLFLDNSYKMMNALSPEEIKTNNLVYYEHYKKTLTPYANSSRDAFKKVVELKEKELETASANMNRELAFYKYFFLASGFAITTLVILFASAVRTSITQALHSFTTVMKETADGNFNQNSIDEKEHTELGQMNAALQKLIHQVSFFIHEINVSFTNATQGNFERSISNEGMHG